MTYNSNPFGNYTSSNVDKREEKANEVPSGTSKEIQEWVGEDKDRAERALAVEESSDNPRKTLVKALKEVIDG